MNKFVEWTNSKSFKGFMAKLYGWGASVVILGALFKIMHWPGAGPMLILGLGTEAVIFFFSAFDIAKPDPDWALVYPQLAGMGEEGEEEDQVKSLSEQITKMMQEAQIEQDSVNRLGEGLKRFGETAASLNNMSNASAATNEYVQSVKGAAQSVSELAGTYSGASKSITENTGALSASYTKVSESLNTLAGAAQESQGYVAGMQKVSGSLNELDGIYRKQITEAGAQITSSGKLSKSQDDAAEQIQKRIGELMQSLSDSLDDTKKFKTELSRLSANLSSLNTVYGNMLTAMNVSVKQPVNSQ